MLLDGQEKSGPETTTFAAAKKSKPRKTASVDPQSQAQIQSKADALGRDIHNSIKSQMVEQERSSGRGVSKWAYKTTTASPDVWATLFRLKPSSRTGKMLQKYFIPLEDFEEIIGEVERVDDTLNVFRITGHKIRIEWIENGTSLNIGGTYGFRSVRFPLEDNVEFYIPGSSEDALLGG